MANFDRESGSSTAAFLTGIGIGAVIGAAAGVLLAPKAGAETREQLGEKFGELKDKVKVWSKDARNKVADQMDEVASRVGA